VNTIRRWPCFARRQVKFAEHLRPSSQVSLASHVIASTLDGTSLPSACYVFGRALRIAPPRKASSGKPRPVQRGLFDGRLVPTSERVPVGRTERRAARVAQYHLSRTISSQRTQYHPNVYGFSSSSARQARAWLAAE
jgi:hypothetical protein